MIAPFKRIGTSLIKTTRHSHTEQIKAPSKTYQQLQEEDNQRISRDNFNHEMGKAAFSPNQSKKSL